MFQLLSYDIIQMNERYKYSNSRLLNLTTHHKSGALNRIYNKQAYSGLNPVLPKILLLHLFKVVGVLCHLSDSYTFSTLSLPLKG